MDQDKWQEHRDFHRKYLAQANAVLKVGRSPSPVIVKDGKVLTPEGLIVAAKVEDTESLPLESIIDRMWADGPWWSTRYATS